MTPKPCETVQHGGRVPQCARTGFPVVPGQVCFGCRQDSKE